MKNEKPKKLLKKHRKIGIGTLTALPVVTGGVLALTAIFMPGANPITPEDPSITVEGDLASFTFDFAEQPDNGVANVEISRQEQTEIVIDDSKNSSVIVSDGKAVVNFRQKQAVSQKGTTNFDLAFTYSVSGQERNVDVKNLQIVWNIPTHTITIECVGNPGVIMGKAFTPGSYQFAAEEGFKVFLDGKSEQDVTEYATFKTDFGDAIWVDKENNKLCWSDAVAPCNTICHISASIKEYGLETTSPVAITFDLYGASIMGGSTTDLTDYTVTSKGLDKTPYYLELNDTSTSIKPTDVSYSIVPDGSSVLPSYIKVDNTGVLSWTPEKGVQTTKGHYYFYIKGNTNYQGVDFEATTQNKIHLYIPEVKLINPTTSIDVVKGTTGEKSLGWQFLTDTTEQKKLTCTILNSKDLTGSYKITAGGTLTWNNVTAAKETVQIRASYGIYWADTSVTINSHTAVVTGGNTTLEYGNQTDTAGWHLEIDKTTQACQLSLVKAESTDPLENKNISVNKDTGVINWTKDALTQKGSISFRVKATVTGAWYAGSYYSDVITLTRQDNPTLSGPKEATVTAGTPGSTTTPFVLSKVSGVTATPILSIVEPVSGVSLDKDGYLHWDETLKASQSPLVLTIKGTVGYYIGDKQITLTIVDKPSIVADATSFEGLGTVGQEYGQFNFMVNGQICRDAALTFTLDSYSSAYWEMIKKGEGDNSYWVLKIKSYAAAEVFDITMTADDQKGHTATLDVTITTFVLDVESPKICSDNSSVLTYQCKAQILDGDTYEYIDPTKATWSISKTIEGLSVGEHTGILTIASGSSIHLTPGDIDTKLVVKYTYKNVEITSSRTFDIHFDNANVAGGTSSITLDEEGNFTDDKAWSLKLGSTYEIDDSTIELIDVSDSLKNKITITDGKVSITGGAAGTFKVKGTSDTGVEATSDVIEVKETQKVYEIHMSTKRGYGIANGVGSLAEELYVTCNEEIVEDPNINWEIIDPTTQNCLTLTPVGKKATLSWNVPESATQGNFCTCHIKAHVLSGWSVTTLDTFTLQVVDPSSVIQLHESSLTPTVNAGEAGEFVIEFKYKEGVAGLEPIDLGLDENSKSLGLNIAYEHTDAWETLKISYTELSFSDEGGEYIGTAWIKFNYYGSIIRYDIPFTVTITR